MKPALLLLILSLAMAGSSEMAAQSESISTVQLGTPRDPTDTGAEASNVFAAAINGHGHVTGHYHFTDGRGRHVWAYIWSRRDGFHVISESAFAVDINDLGQVVGYRYPCVPAFLPDGRACGTPTNFVWDSRNGFTDLGNFRAVAIGNDGRMAGSCQGTSRGCVRTPSGVRQLPQSFFPTDINDRAVVVGQWFRRQPDGSQAPRVAIWMLSTGVRELDPSGPGGTAWAINTSGVVAGGRFANPTTGEAGTATLWTLFGPSPSTYPNSSALAISDRGWAVGEFLPSGSSFVVPALWRVGKGLTRLPAPTHSFGRATGVNDAGEVVGEIGPNGRTRVVLWTVR
jgi:hypothetical protein